MKYLQNLCFLLMVLFANPAKSDTAVICEFLTIQEITTGLTSYDVRSLYGDEVDVFYLNEKEELYGYHIPSCVTHISHTVSNTEIKVKCKLDKQKVVATINRFTGAYSKILDTIDERKWLTTGKCKTSSKLF